MSARVGQTFRFAIWNGLNMKLTDKKILITGANGFVGVNLINALKKHEKNIYALIEPGTDISRIAGVKTKFIDITRARAVKEYVTKIKPDIIIHLAGYINREFSKENILKSAKINVGGTLNLLEGCAGLKKKPKFVFISTGEVYGAEGAPFKETQPCRPLSVYSVTKLSAEDLCEKYSAISGLPLLIVRPSIIYGPNQNCGMFIPSLIKALIGGKDFDMTGGKQLRDFIYIDDFSDDLIKLIKNNAEGIFNISSNKTYSIKEIASKIKKIIRGGAKLNIGKLPYRENEVWDYRLHNGKLKKETGCKPKYTLDDGLKKTIKWYKNQEIACGTCGKFLKDIHSLSLSPKGRG